MWVALASLSTISLWAASDATEVLLRFRSDKEIIKQAPEAASVGDQFTYTLEIKNERTTSGGPFSITGVQVVDQLPPEVTFVSATIGRGSCSHANGRVSCSIPFMDPFETLTIDIVVQATAAGTARNTATVTAFEFDPDEGNNSDTVETVITTPEADVFVRKQAEHSAVAPGDTLAFVLTVGNNGPSAANGVQLSDVVPADLKVVGATPSKGDCTITDNQLNCQFATVAMGEEVTVIVVTVAQAEGTFVNTATVASETPDPNSENNEDTIEVVVEVPPAELVVMKTASADSIQSGAIPTYTVTVTNNGPGIAEGVILRDTLAFDNFSPETFSSTQGDCTQEVRASEGYYLITCTIGTLAAGESATLTITAITTTSSSTIGEEVARNKAVATTTSPETNVENNEAFVDVVVIRPRNVDLAVTKTANVDTVASGGMVTYTLTVTNVGERTASRVELTDLMPPDATDIVITGANCDITTGANLTTLTCNVGDLAPGASVAVMVKITVPETKFGREYGNTALVATTDPNEFDTNPENSRAEVTVYIERLPGDIGITKIAEPDTVEAGQRVTYRLVVVNNGPNEVVDISVTDAVDGSALDSVTVSSFKGRCNQTVNGARINVACSISSLAVGDTASVVIRGVAKRLLRDQTVVNQASASSPAPDENPENNTAQATVLVKAVPPRTASNFEQSGTVADPVNTFTGEFIWWEDESIFNLGGPMPLVFYRYYASGLAADGRIQGAFGPNWLHTYESVLRRIDNRIEVVTNTGRVVVFERDGSTWRLLGSPSIPYQLALQGVSYTFADPLLDRVWIYDLDGRLIRVTDGKGNGFDLTYVGDQLRSVEDGLGRVLAFGYNGDGHLASVSDGVRTATFSYTDGLLVSFTNPRGETTTYTYANHPQPGLLTTYTLPNGNAWLNNTYDVQGRVVEQVDGLGNTYRLTYTGAQMQIADPLGNTQGYTHDDDGRVLGWTDEVGQTVQFTYDTAGRRSTVTDRLGAVTQVAYHEPSGKIAELIYPDGTSFRFTYTARNVAGVMLYDVASVTSPDDEVDQFEYDSQGNLTAWVDRGGVRWSYTYNSRGQVEEAQNPEGGRITYQYTTNGMLASVTDHSGNTTTYEYDQFSNMLRYTRPDGTGRSYVYDGSDRITGVTLERGEQLAFTYDPNGNLETITNALGHVTRFSYDTLDRLTTVTDALGGQTTRLYDALSRVVQYTGANGGTVSYGYDATGRKTSVTDGGGQTTSFAYDAEGVLRSVTDPLGQTVQYITNNMGRVTEIVYPEAERFSMTYDAMGRTVLQNDPEGNAMTAMYDARGWPTGLALPNGLGEAQYTRNSFGARSELIDPRRNTWGTEYDLQGRVESLRDPLGRQAQLSYNARNEVEQIVLPGGLGNVQIRYDAAGQVVQRAFSDGTDLQYTYDDAFRLTEANGLSLRYDAENRVIASNGIELERDRGGRVVAQTLAPGKTIRYRYNSRDQVEMVTDWLGGETRFTYDAAGRLARLTRPNGMQSVFTYDANSRLLALEETLDPQDATARRSRLDFTYDQRGNLSQAVREVPLAPTLEEAERSQAYDAASQTDGFTYDALGRLVGDSVRTYTWDLASRLTSYQEKASTVQFTYDAGSHIIRRQEGAETQSFIWNYATTLPTLAVERNDTDDQQYYIYGPNGGLLYRVDAATDERRYFHFDERGNTLYTTDEQGDVASRFAYGPYGEAFGEADSADERFTYLGAFSVMKEGSLYNAHMRYYDPMTGRFLSPDPLRTPHPLDTSPYHYGYANPLRYLDPAGLKPGEPYGEGCSSCEEGCSCRESTRSALPPMFRNNPIKVYEATKPKSEGVVLAGAVLIIYDGSEAQFTEETKRYVEELRALGIDVYASTATAIGFAARSPRREQLLGALGLTPERLRSISGILTIGHGNKGASATLDDDALTGLMSVTGKIDFLAMLSCESYDFYERYRASFDTYLDGEAAVFGFHGPAPLGNANNGFGPVFPVFFDGSYSPTFETDPLLQFIIGGTEASRYRAQSYLAQGTAWVQWSFSYSYAWWESLWTGNFRPEGGAKSGSCPSGGCR